MILDSHQHFWRYNAGEYNWIDQRMQTLQRNFLPADFEATAAPLGVGGSVAVQARQTVEETNWLLELASHSDFIKGVVGWAALADNGRDVGETLDRWSAHPKLCGFRHVLQLEADEYFERADFNAALREFPARHLAYDLLVFSRQLPAALAWVDQHPNLTIVLDHMGKPSVTPFPPSDWQDWIKELAKRENIYCKFSGLITETPDWKSDPDSFRSYFDILLNAFGPKRLMFGSDWPVCLLGMSYSEWFGFVESCVHGLSSAERDAVMGGACAAAYNLDL